MLHQGCPGKLLVTETRVCSIWCGLPTARRALCSADCQDINCDLLINTSLQTIVMRAFAVMCTKQEEI